MSLKYKMVEEQIENLLQYLQTFLPLANFHMVDYFTKDGYRNYIPENIRQEIKDIGEEEVINKIFEDDYSKLPNLLHYAEKSREFTLKNCQNFCLQTEDFQQKLIKWGCEEFLRLKLDIFMTTKKSHEVDLLSFVAAAIRNVAKTSHIVDIGDGKGYLSSMLALHYKIPVLGIDASAINTTGAVKRVQKLSKIWNSVVNTENKTKETSANIYKQVTQFVHENIDFSNLVQNIFLDKPKGLSLVGLHTCGNLSASSIRIFNNNSDIKTICNVGCCYHLLSEEYEVDPLKRVNFPTEGGFPMSSYLKQKKFVLGRAARMIAAQSVDRIFYNRDLPNKTIFYRALFEVLIERKYGYLASTQKHVGRFRKECLNFADYVKKASKRINLDVEISDVETDKIFNDYKNRIHELHIFYLIRCMLSPIIESLILLDRLLFLLEGGCDKVFIVQLFDPVVSPRCYALIAIK